jgi:hypothetical protein
VTLAHVIAGGAPNVHVLQGDIYRLPLNEGIFDFAYGLGVLHHVPTRREASRASSLWCGPAETCSSGSTASARLPLPVQWALCVAGAAALEATLWMPSRVLSRVPGGASLGCRIPLSDSAHRTFHAKLRTVFDRINPPVTHHHSDDELPGGCEPPGSNKRRS